MIYLLDANTYIEAKNRYYDMEFCPAYWDWLDQQFAMGVAGSIDMIGYRILGNGNIFHSTGSTTGFGKVNGFVDDKQTLVVFAVLF